MENRIRKESNTFLANHAACRHYKKSPIVKLFWKTTCSNPKSFVRCQISKIIRPAQRVAQHKRHLQRFRLPTQPSWRGGAEIGAGPRRRLSRRRCTGLRSTPDSTQNGYSRGYQCEPLWVWDGGIVLCGWIHWGNNKWIWVSLRRNNGDKDKDK